MTERWSSLERALPFSAGVLAGMALLLVLPEALRHSSPVAVLGLCVAGLVLFSGLESLVHAARPSPHPGVVGLIPLIAAMSIHNALDGWNIAVGLRIGPVNAVTVFIAGMALHKLLGGLMIGAVFRAGSRNRVQAAVWAGATESFTLIGALANQRLSSQLSESWSAGLLSVTAGSFLYLGYHSLERARRTGGLGRSLAAASFGLGAIWLLVLLE
ncbi:MAG: hypothetical protein H7Y20_16310 [Bryobacteraceae bacterium]|nr:hypothetical protein [Bryobacteraceae bacterium]